jgi:hypothetical protein
LRPPGGQSPRSRSPDRIASRDLTAALWAFTSSKLLVGALVGVGATLRLWQYLANASLGVDEAALARNITARPLSALFTPLDFGQVAPPGFLLVEKAAVSLLGDQEYALRLFPLVCGLASLMLFDNVTKRIVGGPARTLAVMLFSLGLPFVYYTSQAKQYAGDIAAALVILRLAMEFVNGRVGWWHALQAGLAGAILPWFSYASIFALAGTGMVLTARTIRHRARAGQALGCVLLWAASASAALVVAVHNMNPDDSAFLHRYWTSGFMPLRPGHGDALRWMWNTLRGVFASFSNAPPTLDAGMHFRRPWIFASFALVGTVLLWIQRRECAALLLAPLVILWAASAAELYPFSGRAALSVVPSLLILASAGAERVALVARRAVGPSALGVFAFLALFPLDAIATHLPPDWQEDLRPIIQYVGQHRQPGDAVYVYYGAGQVFLYYAGREGFREDDYEVGRCAMDEPRSYLERVDRLRGRPRVWMIFSHSLQGGREIRLMISYLDAIGRRLDAVPARRLEAPLSAGAYAFLYDLSGPPRSTWTAVTYPVPADWNAQHRAWLCYGPMTPLALRDARR